MATIKRCPQCRSSKITWHAAALTGEYHCTRCGYIGVLVLEEDVDAP